MIFHAREKGALDVETARLHAGASIISAVSSVHVFTYVL
jgi:hypothetical protein